MAGRAQRRARQGPAGRIAGSGGPQRTTGAAFAYAGTGQPDGRQLVASAVLAGFRGPWAHGWAFHDGARHECEGELQLACELSLLATHQARLVGWSGQGQRQPIEGPDGLTLVQLGIVYGADNGPLDMLDSIRNQGTGELARDIARGLGDLDLRDTYSVIVMSDTGQLVVCRMGLPLYTTSRREGVYVTSYVLAPDSNLIPEVEPYLVGGPVHGQP